jgi:MYXO-CTERM domain-containing protein
VLKPYIHPGAYFLALKLRSGESAGSIVPVIIKYTSDLPMIPLILTSVGAVPDMGIQVWLLGEHRAIPRNYRHVVIDDMPIWLRLESYESLLVRAIHEAPLKHAFVTEYAGPSTPMVGQLDPTGRFGSAAELKLRTDPATYLSYLLSNGFSFDSTLIALLQKYLPEPANLVMQGVKPVDYYQNYSWYNAQWPQPDGGAGPAFDASGLTDEIEARIVDPTLATGKLFRDHPYLTRLYTALSPEDMTADPVFSENPDLANVSLAHNATLTYPCRGDGYVRSGDTGLESQLPGRLSISAPSALRIETLREAGQPIVDTDNHDAIALAIGPVDHGSMTSFDPSPGPPAAMPAPANHGCGCAVAFTPGDRGMLLLLVGALLLIRRRTRRRA